ncbi:MAG: hypothetical protein IKI50_06250 [Clostridia bacterium]|nr:hypothetical protein [Clostridia bacterium]
MGLFDPIDWNGDGKCDFFDDMIEYDMYLEYLKEESKGEGTQDEADLAEWW